MIHSLSRGLRRLVFLVVTFLPFVVVEGSLSGTRWPDLKEEEMALSAPRIDPEAGVEILLRDIDLDDRREGTTYTYFVRLKVFDQRGVEALQTIELDTLEGARISRVNARVIRPDGSIEEVEKDAIHKRNLWRVGREKSERTSFALPGLTPGSIVDYRYNIWEKGSAYGYRLLTYARHPTHELRFRVRYYPHAVGSWTWEGFDGSQFENPIGGVHQLVLHDLPAAPDEDFLPTPDKVQPWITVYYISETGDDWTEKFWKRYAQWLNREGRKVFKPKDRAVRAKAVELSEGIEDDRERLRRLYLYCQQEIGNLDSSRAYTAAERKKLKDARHGGDVLKYGYGSSYHINALFASMAGALGYEVALASCSDRAYSSFNTAMAYYRAMPHSMIAVRLPGKTDWGFYSPGGRHLSFGQLHWRNEYTTALIGNFEGDLLFVQTPVWPSRETVVKRTARFELTEAGDLEGEVTIDHGGHFGSMLRTALDVDAGARAEEFFEELMEDPFPNAEIEDVEVWNLDDTDKVLTVRFRLKLPAYADATSSRLFLEPAVFQKEEERTFEEPDRKFPVVFPFRWEEVDDVQILLPEIFRPEEASAPASVVDTNALAHVVRMGYSPNRNMIAYNRQFRLDIGGIAQEGYPAIRALFSAIHEQDHHLITLRKLEPEADAGGLEAPSPEPEDEAEQDLPGGESGPALGKASI